jgi:hypothetical protein
VLIVGEGFHETGREECANSPLGRLVHRILNEPESVTFNCHLHYWKDKPPSFKHIPKTGSRNKGSRTKQKIKWLIERAWSKGFDAVVILVDRDRLSPKERSEQLADGRDEMARTTQAQYPPCAVGVAVEAFDAWMICDQVAIKEADGDPDKFTSRPEDVKKPKKKAAEIFGCPPNGTGLGQYYPAVAEKADLDNLRKCCPKGFGAFADDVKAHLAGLAAPEDN